MIVNNLYNAERIIACLRLLLSIIDNYVLEYDTYREDDYIKIINDTISLYDDMDDLKNATIEILEFNIDNYDIWKTMISFFGNVFTSIDFPDEFPICNDNGDELIYNGKDAMDILEYIDNISREEDTDELE